MSTAQGGHSADPDRPASERPAAEPGAGGAQTGVNVCPACGGAGIVDANPCGVCGGDGTVEEPVGDA